MRYAEMRVFMTQQEIILFENTKQKIIGVERQRLGIGTYGEKTVHAIFKNYYEPDEDKHEIPIDRYVADIYNKRISAFYERGTEDE